MSKSRFNEIKDVITRGLESRLMAKLGKRSITLKNAEELLKGVHSGKIGEKKARRMYNNIASDVNDLNKLGHTKSRKKCCLFLCSCKKFFWGIKEMIKQMTKQMMNQMMRQMMK